MNTNDLFLTKLRDDPADNATRLVYADWLEEQGDEVSVAMAEFLRLTVDQAALIRKGVRKKRRLRLQELAATLDTNWLAVVSHLPIENCRQEQGDESNTAVTPIPFEFLCDRQWQGLRPTEDDSVRFCEACQQNVHYCDTIVEARRHAWAGRCVAIDLGVIRREDDLEPEQMWLGRPSVATLRAEEKRMEPDEVSAERERRKRKSR